MREKMFYFVGACSSQRRRTQRYDYGPNPRRGTPLRPRGTVRYAVIASAILRSSTLTCELFLLRLLDELDCHLRRSGHVQCFDAGIDLSQFDEPTRIAKIAVKYG
jgi:hypothetical protein